MTALEALADARRVSAVAKAARVRKAAVLAALAGREVWPATYERIESACKTAGIELPPPAPRVPRSSKRPCPECAKLRARVAELEAQLARSRTIPRLPKQEQPMRVKLLGFPDDTVAQIERPAPCGDVDPDSAAAG